MIQICTYMIQRPVKETTYFQMTLAQSTSITMISQWMSNLMKKTNLFWIKVILTTNSTTTCPLALSAKFMDLLTVVLLDSKANESTLKRGVRFKGHDHLKVTEEVKTTRLITRSCSKVSSIMAILVLLTIKCQLIICHRVSKIISSTQVLVQQDPLRIKNYRWAKVKRELWNLSKTKGRLLNKDNDKKQPVVTLLTWINSMVLQRS